MDDNEFLLYLTMQFVVPLEALYYYLQGEEKIYYESQ